MPGKKALMPTSKRQVDKNQGKAIMKLKKDVTKLKKQNENSKSYIDSILNHTPGTAGQVGQITAVTAGTTVGHRSGENTVLTSMEASITATPNTSTVYDSMRVGFIYWKADRQGTPPSLGNILANTANFDSAYNPDFRDDFVVLWDKKFDLSASNGSKHYKIKKNLKNKLATYYGTSAANYGRGMIFYYVLATDNVNLSTFNAYTRVHYHD